MPPIPDALPSLPRPSVPTPSLPDPPIPVPTPSIPVPTPSTPTLDGLRDVLRPSRETVDLAFGLSAVGLGTGIVATAAVTAADAVLPLAFLKGWLASLVGRLTP